MKKLCPILLALVFALALCACDGTSDVPNSEPPSPTVTVTPEPTPTPTPTPSESIPVETPPAPFTAPDGTVVCGVDLSGMTREEALAALTDGAAGFALTLDVSGKSMSIPGESVGLALDSALFDAYWLALERGETAAGQLYAVNLPDLEQVIANGLERSAKNPYVAYSNAQGKFVVVSGTNGMDYDVPAIAGQTAAALSALAADCSVSAAGYEIAPAVRNDDPRLLAAAEAANHYLTITLSYSFTNGMGGPMIEPLNAATIASFVRISGDYSVSISRSAINNHASSLGSRYGGDTTTGDFITSAGIAVPFTVKYYGQQVNTTALADDIYTCLTTGISGVREAEYLPETQATMAYGGSYVEIDLTAQRLWVYKDGVCVVDTPIVSGCVADNNETPIGVYSIYNKAADCWLVGPTWRDHVDYWMPFYGAYGLHDASWRDEFGGEIYIHEGSHGCPNLPVEIAGQVYNNVSIGTPVILYGGLSEPVDLTQEIGGTAAYYFSRFDTSFQLDYTLRYDEAEVTFTSDNPDVVTVDANGTVTIHGAGNANITISAAAFTYHTAASLTVQVNISPNCLPENHAYGEWTQTVAPACETTGSTSRTCSICGNVEAQEIPATGHSYGEDGLCVNGCGTAVPAESEAPAASDAPAESETPAEDEAPAGEDTPAEDEPPTEGTAEETEQN